MRLREFGEVIRRYMPPDREIIVRTGDRVAYLRVPRWVQVSILSAVFVALAWIGLATHLNFNHLEIIASRDARIARTEGERRDVLRELETAHREIMQVSQRADTSRMRAERLDEFNSELKSEIAGLEAQIARHMAALDQAAERRETLDRQVAGLRQRVGEVNADRLKSRDEIRDLRAALAQDEQEKARLSERIAELLPVIEGLEDERDRIADAASALREDLVRQVAERDRIADERDTLAGERDLIAQRFASLTDQLATLESAQEQIISRFDSQTVDSIELVEKTLAITGVDVDRMLGRLMAARSSEDETGIGGPFIAALDETGGEQASGLASDIAAVEGRVTRWRGLQTLLARLPLTVPLDNYRVTSTFGRRVDPMAHRAAMHEGIDFSSERRAEVRATSPGKVVFVGWRGGFGKMVEVDHGLGIRTRYAHLSKIYVKAGQQVDFRDKLGQIGNTGRSTGEHLHYEVTVDGRAQDPANFMKAGQYVFKN